MGLKGKIQKSISKIFPALDDMVENVAYHSAGLSGYDPVASTQVEEGGEDYEVDILVSDYDIRYIDNRDILPTDKKAIISGYELEFTPKPHDTIDIDSMVWEVIHVSTDPAEAVWTLQIRIGHEGSIGGV